MLHNGISPPPPDWEPLASEPPAWQPRGESVLARQQVDGMARWHRARRMHEAAITAQAVSREQRLDVARRMDVLRQQHRAMIARADGQLRDSARLLSGSSARRALLVHRNTWYLDKLTAALQERGVWVVARLDNGADAVGAAVAEQPDLMFVEDTLPMLTGIDVVREVLAYAPDTVLAAQVAYDQGAAVMLAAGARTVFTRRVPPREVADGLADLLLPRRR